jgi:hypothetical protein
MKEYKTVSASDVSDLTKKVNTALSQGWKCQGGPVVTVGQTGSTTYVQAMIK